MTPPAKTGFYCAGPRLLPTRPEKARDLAAHLTCNASKRPSPRTASAKPHSVPKRHGPEEGEDLLSATPKE